MDSEIQKFKSLAQLRNTVVVRKIIAIGNVNGVTLPRAWLEKMGRPESVELEFDPITQQIVISLRKERNEWDVQPFIAGSTKYHLGNKNGRKRKKQIEGAEDLFD